MTHATEKLLQEVLSLPDDIRQVFLKEIQMSFSSIDVSDSLTTSDITTESSSHDNNIRTLGEELLPDTFESYFNSEQNKLLRERLFKMKNSSVAYLTASHLTKKMKAKNEEIVALRFRDKL